MTVDAPFHLPSPPTLEQRVPVTRRGGLPTLEEAEAINHPGHPLYTPPEAASRAAETLRRASQLIPTLEQRLDAAAEEFREKVSLVNGTSWPDLHRAAKAGYRRSVESICRAFAPEHFKDSKEDR